MEITRRDPLKYIRGATVQYHRVPELRVFLRGLAERRALDPFPHSSQDARAEHVPAVEGSFYFFDVQTEVRVFLVRGVSESALPLRLSGSRPLR